MRHWLRAHGWLLGVLAIAAFAMLFRLGDRPVENWDEGIHGAVSIDMVERGDWVTPWYAGGTYFRKPPLKLWMSAALMEALPTPSDSPSRWEGEKTLAWALRLPNAVAGILMSLLVAWWMWQWRRSRLEAFLAGAIVATMRPIFFHAFRTGEMDGLLTLFVTGALYCWWKAVSVLSFRGADGDEESHTKVPARHDVRSLASLEMTRVARRWLALCGAAIGLAIMTKSAAGLLPLPIIAVHAMVTGIWRRISIRDVLVLVLVLVAIIAPWHLAMTALHGVTFWNDYFGWHIVKRATQAIHNPTAGIWWYLPTLMRKFSPYAWWLLPALLFSLLHLRNKSGARQRGADLLEATSVEASCQLPEAQRGETQTGAEWGEAEFGRGIPHASEVQRPMPERPSPKGGRDHQLACGRTTPLLLLWFLITLALFTIAKTKFDWYLLPLYPAAAMLLAMFLTAARDVARNRMTAALHLAALAIAVFALPSLYPDGSTLGRAVARAYAPFGHPIALTGIAVATIVGAIAITHRRWGAIAAGRVAQVLVLVFVLVPGFAVTASHLIRTTPPGPFPAIAAAVHGTGGHLVSYGMDYKQHPAGYFILRGALSGDVRVLDGRRRDVARTIAMLREREHGFLLTQNETESRRPDQGVGGRDPDTLSSGLPPELLQVVGDPRTFGDFTLWTRR